MIMVPNITLKGNKTPIHFGWKKTKFLNHLVAVFTVFPTGIQTGLMNIALTAVSITDPVFVPHRIMKKPLAA